jgi:hypothetical protein
LRLTQAAPLPTPTLNFPTVPAFSASDTPEERRQAKVQITRSLLDSTAPYHQEIQTMYQELADQTRALLTSALHEAEQFFQSPLAKF